MMWYLIFTIAYVGLAASRITGQSTGWNVLYYIMSFVSIFATIRSEIKKEERIETLEKKLKNFEGDDK